MNKRKFAIWLKKVVSSQLFAVIVSVTIVLIIVQINLVNNDVSDLIKLNTVLSVGIVSIVTWIIQLADQLIEKRIEEKLKLNDNIAELIKLYKKEDHYEINNNKSPVVVSIPKDSKITIELSSNKYIIDQRIVANMNVIMNAHKNSKFKNKNMFRLNELVELKKDKEYQLIISESNQYNTLLTNRAMDAAVVKNVTIRDLFEYGPRLTSFEESKLANGIGLNIVVKSSDGYFILIRRNDKNPTGKNISGVTSSMLYDLYLDCERQKQIEEGNFYEKVLKQSIYRGLRNSLFMFKGEKYNEDVINLNDAHLLGMIRNLIEGGKPELIYLYELKHTIDEVINIFNEKGKTNTGSKKLIYFNKESLDDIEPNKIKINKKTYEVSVVTSYAINEAIKN